MCIRDSVHPCRIKLVHEENNLVQPEDDIEIEGTNVTEEQLPSAIISNGDQSSEESDIEDSPTPIHTNASTSAPTTQTLTETQRQPTPAEIPQQKLKLKPNLYLKYKDNQGDWQKARIISRAGKVGGKHDGWFNVETETGMKRAVNFSNIKDIEIDDSPSEVTLMTNTSEVLTAKSKELQSWIDNSVYTEIPDKGQDTMSLRWVVTPKMIDGQPSVKARLVARGFEEIQNFKTDSPTCSKEGLRLALTIIASNNWTLNSLDVKTAFLQGKEIDREVIVQPPKEANTKNFWKLSKTVYGLADASRSWYLKLRSELIKLGGKPIELDQGIFIWSSNRSLIGIIVCFVDDVIWAGSPSFISVISKLKTIFKTSSEHMKHFRYIGIDLNQHENGTITISQNDYINELEPITLNEERFKISKDEPIDETERSKLRQSLGKLNWLACMSRPEISFTVSDVSSRITTATIADIKVINKTIKFIKSNPCHITIPRLDLNNLGIKLFTDASFNNLEGGQSQGGHIVFLTDSSGNSSPISWSSNKVRRVVRSTLAAETLASVDGADTACFLAEMVGEFLAKTPDVVCYTDSRSLFECAGSTKSVSDRRLRVEINALREMINKDEIILRWIDGRYQMANVLTKNGASLFSPDGSTQIGGFLSLIHI